MCTLIYQGWATSGFIRISGFFFFFLLSWKKKSEPGKLTIFSSGKKWRYDPTLLQTCHSSRFNRDIPIFQYKSRRRPGNFIPARKHRHFLPARICQHFFPARICRHFLPARISQHCRHFFFRPEIAGISSDQKLPAYLPTRNFRHIFRLKIAGISFDPKLGHLNIHLFFFYQSNDQGL